MPTISVYLNDETIKRIQSITGKNNKGRSRFIQEAVRDKLGPSHPEKPEEGIICDICGDSIKSPEEAILAWGEEEQENGSGRCRIYGFNIHHREPGGWYVPESERPECYDGKSNYYYGLTEVLNPLGFMNFILRLLRSWKSGCKLEDYNGLANVLVKLAPYVLREDVLASSKTGMRDYITALAEPVKRKHIQGKEDESEQK